MCFNTPFLTITGDCSSDTPASSIVLNRLPGISLKMAANVADEDYVKGVTMLRELEEDAIELVRFDVLDKLSSKYQFSPIGTRTRLGWRTDNFTAVNEEVGIQLERSTQKGLYKVIQLPAIEVQVDADVTATFTINVDGVETTREEELKKNSSNVINLELEATDLIRVTWNPGGVGVGSSIFSRIDSSCGVSCAGGCIEARNVVGPDYELSGTPSGIILEASCRLSECSLMSHYKREFAQLLRLQVGIKVMKEVIMSTRSNPVVANSRDSAREILTHWEGGVDPVTGEDRRGEYRARLEQFCKMLEKALDQLPGDGFECNRLRLIPSIP